MCRRGGADLRYTGNMFFELLDIDTGNLIGTYETEPQALAVVRRAYQLNGSGYVASLALGYEDDDGEGEQLATGADLLARALADDAGGTARSA
jgi:hypothetical protein